MGFNFGNLALTEERIVVAQESFSVGLTMANDIAPTHALIAAFHYKLAFIQSQFENYDNALYVTMQVCFRVHLTSINLVSL
jgi:hypothetical protein